ncbi:MAG: hypothetical protein DRH57_06930 [Candidatus Cloacimonadota bacterium]|nr:MAG: hypothetical protein DRH57_06930 [Candidatus Cloacimonadota bacterium]
MSRILFEINNNPKNLLYKSVRGVFCKVKFPSIFQKGSFTHYALLKHIIKFCGYSCLHNSGNIFDIKFCAFDIRRQL